MNIPNYITWLVSEPSIDIRDGKKVECYKLEYDINDDKILSDWAKHIRRHYESDEVLEESIVSIRMNKESYLRELVIPQREMTKGPAMRSADFGEIIFSDLLEFVKGFEVPRCKQYNRATPTQSEQGTDILAYKFEKADYSSTIDDELLAIESKMGATSSSYSKINEAIKHSIKDELRAAVTLNYYRKKLKQMGKNEESERIARFQRKSEADYKLRLIAAAAISRGEIEKEVNIKFTDEGEIKLEKIDSIFLIHCDNLMNLVHELYERCIE
ncbi:DUF1837 domain-containing protein [Listeria monocytogenes]|nr:DUF1837 domain-containing protein [Listeria monocytogenes]